MTASRRRTIQAGRQDLIGNGCDALIPANPPKERYTVEKAKLEARLKGLPVNEQALTDGSIKLQIVEHG